VIIAGELASPKSDPDDAAFEVLHAVLGGQFTARMNMNLREDKGYTYGAFTFKLDARGQGVFGAFSQVRTDVTKESMAEMAKELREIRGPRPVTEGELQQAQDNLTLSLPGQYESIGGIANKITDVVTYDLPENHYATYPDRVRSTDIPGLTALAKEKILPDKMVWVVVGDRASIEEGIQELGLGTIRYLDENGRPIGGRASR
jgi:zinc protease